MQILRPRSIPTKPESAFYFGKVSKGRLCEALVLLSLNEMCVLCRLHMRSTVLRHPTECWWQFHSDTQQVTCLVHSSLQFTEDLDSLCVTPI